VQTTFSDFQQAIAQGVESLPLKKTPEGLYEPMRYLLSLGGKRMRPLLSLLAAAQFQGDPLRALPVGLAAEVFHNFTLMHDDVMDNAPLRRGKTTVHEKWDLNTAILSGDGMFAAAYQCLEKLPAETLLPIFSRFNRCALEVCEGQQWDVEFATREDVSIDDYLEMIRLKTAVLPAFCMEGAALAVGASEKEAEAFREIGEALGVGFQLMDDYLDVFGDPKKFGKQVGGDILENKKTFLLLSALQDAAPSEHQSLEKWLFAENPNPEDKVFHVRALFERIGIKEKTRAKMAEYAQSAREKIQQLPSTSEQKALLLHYADKLAGREV